MIRLVTDVIGTKKMIRQVARCMVMILMEQWELQGIIAATVPQLTVGVHRQVQPRGHQHVPIAPPTGLVLLVLLARIWNTKILSVKMDSLTIVKVWAQQQLIAATALIRWKYVLLSHHPPNQPKCLVLRNPLHPSRQRKW